VKHRRVVARFLSLAALLCGAMSITSAAWSDDTADTKGATKRLTAEEAKKLKSPVPFSKASIARGKVLYTRECTECHGADGKSLVDVVANATDLTDPKAWKSGTSEGEVFRSIRDGAGEAMPPFDEKISKVQDFWDLTNYLRSLWPESARPKLQEDTPP
jgi:mono/diheme cytochrome c family protein